MLCEGAGTCEDRLQKSLQGHCAKTQHSPPRLGHKHHGNRHCVQGAQWPSLLRISSILRMHQGSLFNLCCGVFQIVTYDKVSSFFLIHSFYHTWTECGSTNAWKYFPYKHVLVFDRQDSLFLCAIPVTTSLLFFWLPACIRALMLWKKNKTDVS